MATKHKSVETKWYEQRDELVRGLQRLPRRQFAKVMAASAGAIMAKRLLPPHSFQLVEVAHAAPLPGAAPKFTFAYVSDTTFIRRT